MNDSIIWIPITDTSLPPYSGSLSASLLLYNSISKEIQTYNIIFPERLPDDTTSANSHIIKGWTHWTTDTITWDTITNNALPPVPLWCVLNNDAEHKTQSTNVPVPQRLENYTDRGWTSWAVVNTP